MRERDRLAAFLEDAAHYPGGHARAVAFPHSELDVARLVREHRRLLPIGAQSSLTGGATPMGDVIISTARLNRIDEIARQHVRLQPGVLLVDLEQALARDGRYYPPAPTFNGASVGGTVATNAAGAATFKYGTTRRWVRALTIVLASGEALDINRGETVAHPDGYFEIETSQGVVRIPVPGYAMPGVPKCSAGYYAAPGMDLIDLFIGSEGTLGIVTEITLEVLPCRPASCWALVPVICEDEGLALVDRLRRRSQETWRTRSPEGVDVAAIENMDRRCLELLMEDGQDRKNGISFPRGASIAILVQLELPPGTTSETAYDEIGGRVSGHTGLPAFCHLLEAHGVMDHVEMAVPGDRRRGDQLFAIREAVPAAVNHRVARAKRTVDGRIEKTAADMIVPFARFAEMMAIYREGFESRGLDYAVWGHVSDGNVHPNVIPRSLADVTSGQQAILEFGREAVRLGGCPLAEHGVGRSAVKQALLRQLYGDRGLDEMRLVKRALDPDWKLAPGVLFAEPQPSPRA